MTAQAGSTLSRPAWEALLALTGSVGRAKLLSLSVPQFPHQWNSADRGIRLFIIAFIYSLCV